LLGVRAFFLPKSRLSSEYVNLKGFIMATAVAVTEIPNCDFCKLRDKLVPAQVDGRTVLGPWANMCMDHFIRYGVGLGTGYGQLLILLKGTD